MDSTIGFININQNKRVSKLTTISVVFTPINIVAGIGGMSEFSMMTQGVPWPGRLRRVPDGDAGHRLRCLLCTAPL
jgi:hypothetical protein